MAAGRFAIGPAPDRPMFHARSSAFLVVVVMVAASCAGVLGWWQNRTSGEGWRLVASGTDGLDLAYQVQVAINDDEWQSLWRTLDTTEPAPTIDLRSEIAVSFAEGIGRACHERRLDDVVVDRVQHLVYSITSDPLGPRMCTLELAGAAYFVVALARDSLPDSPFIVRLRNDLVCADRSCGHIEEVTVDLRS